MCKIFVLCLVTTLIDHQHFDYNIVIIGVLKFHIFCHYFQCFRITVGCKYRNKDNFLICFCRVLSDMILPTGREQQLTVTIVMDETEV